jgi:hypothetical protein
MRRQRPRPASDPQPATTANAALSRSDRTDSSELRWGHSQFDIKDRCSDLEDGLDALSDRLDAAISRLPRDSARTGTHSRVVMMRPCTTCLNFWSFCGLAAASPLIITFGNHTLSLSGIGRTGKPRSSRSDPVIRRFGPTP